MDTLAKMPELIERTKLTMKQAPSNPRKDPAEALLSTLELYTASTQTRVKKVKQNTNEPITDIGNHAGTNWDQNPREFQIRTALPKYAAITKKKYSV